MYGADAEALDRLASEVSNAAAELRSAQTKLSSAIHSTPWHGANAERFRQTWDSDCRRGFGGALSFLHEASLALHRNATQQREASGLESPARKWLVYGPIYDEGGWFTPDHVFKLIKNALGSAGSGADVLMRIAENLVTDYHKGGRVLQRWHWGDATEMRRWVGEAEDVGKWSKRVKYAGYAAAAADFVISTRDQYIHDAGKAAEVRAVRAVGVGAFHAGFDVGSGLLIGAATVAILPEAAPVALAVGIGIGAGFVVNEGLDLVNDRWHLDDKIADGAEGAFNFAKHHPVLRMVGEQMVAPGLPLVDAGANLAARGLRSLF